MLWKYPAVGSGFSYPVPWGLIWDNIVINFKFLRAAFASASLAEKRAYLKSHGVNNSIAFAGIYGRMSRG